jgi:hypothetical protein
MWLACATQEEIAAAVETPRQTVTDWLTDFAESSANEESAKWHGFEPPIYNVWKLQKTTNKVDHFGNSEPKWVENLL